MIKTINCGWYMNDNPREDYLRYVLENFDNIETEEKLEAIKYIFDDYFTVIYDEEHEKIFVYGHGEMIEATDELIKEWIEDDLVDWSVFFDDEIK